MRRPLVALAAFALCVGSFAAVQAQDRPTTRPGAEAEYPVDICPVMDVKLDSKGKPVTRVFDGRTVKVCCARCVRTFQREAEKYHAKLDALIVKARLDAYPLKTCVVGGEELGGMGEPVNYVHRPTNQLVRFCCAGCVDSFKKTPDQYLARIDEAAKAAESN